MSHGADLQNCGSIIDKINAAEELVACLINEKAARSPQRPQLFKSKMKVKSPVLHRILTTYIKPDNSVYSPSTGYDSCGNLKENNRCHHMDNIFVLDTFNSKPISTLPHCANSEADNKTPKKLNRKSKDLNRALDIYRSKHTKVGSGFTKKLQSGSSSQGSCFLFNNYQISSFDGEVSSPHRSHDNSTDSLFSLCSLDDRQPAACDNTDSNYVTGFQHVNEQNNSFDRRSIPGYDAVQSDDISALCMLGVEDSSEVVVHCATELLLDCLLDSCVRIVSRNRPASPQRRGFRCGAFQGSFDLPAVQADKDSVNSGGGSGTGTSAARRPVSPQNSLRCVVRRHRQLKNAKQLQQQQQQQQQQLLVNDRVEVAGSTSPGLLRFNDFRVTEDMLHSRPATAATAATAGTDHPYHANANTTCTTLTAATATTYAVDAVTDTIATNTSATTSTNKQLSSNNNNSGNHAKLGKDIKLPHIKQLLFELQLRVTSHVNHCAAE